MPAMWKYEYETQKDKSDKVLTAYVTKRFDDGWELVSQTTGLLEKPVGINGKRVYRESYFIWRIRNS